MHDVMSPASKKGFDIICMPRMALMLGMVICIRTTGDVYVVCMSKNPYGITNIYTVCYTTWPTSICCNQGASMGFCQQAAKCCVCGQCFGGGGRSYPAGLPLHNCGCSNLYVCATTHLSACSDVGPMELVSLEVELWLRKDS